MKERQELIETLRRYMETYSMGIDAHHHAGQLIKDLEAEELEEREDER